MPVILTSLGCILIAADICVTVPARAVVYRGLNEITQINIGDSVIYNETSSDHQVPVSRNGTQRICHRRRCINTNTNCVSHNLTNCQVNYFSDGETYFKTVSIRLDFQQSMEMLDNIAIRIGRSNSFVRISDIFNVRQSDDRH